MVATLSLKQRRSERSQHERFMATAIRARRRANCRGNRVGSILVVSEHRLIAGFNAAPKGILSCLDGGCYRCRRSEKYGPGQRYDLCICLHAEQNALLQAARSGPKTVDSVLYSTIRPCLICSKELLQAGVRAIYYLHDGPIMSHELLAELRRIESAFVDGVHQLAIADPDVSWAMHRTTRIRTADESNV